MHRPSLLRLRRSPLVLAARRRAGARGLLPARGTHRRAAGGAAPSAAGTPAAELRLGYFPNVTHAPALIGVANGYFQQELGSTKLTTQTFNAGPEAVERAARRLAGRRLHRLRPGHQRLREVQRRGGPADRRLRPPAARSSWSRPTSPRPSSSRARSSPRRRLGNTQDIALKKWLDGEQPDQRHGPGRGDGAEHGEPAHAGPVQVRARWTAAGCPSRGARGWSRRRREGAASTRRPCGRTASSRPRC